jgi:hypothetical protein
VRTARQLRQGPPALPLQPSSSVARPLSSAAQRAPREVVQRNRATQYPLHTVHTHVDAVLPVRPTVGLPRPAAWGRWLLRPLRRHHEVLCKFRLSRRLRALLDAAGNGQSEPDGKRLGTPSGFMYCTHTGTQPSAIALVCSSSSAAASRPGSSLMQAMCGASATALLPLPRCLGCMPQPGVRSHPITGWSHTRHSTPGRRGD